MARPIPHDGGDVPPALACADRRSALATMAGALAAAPMLAALSAGAAPAPAVPAIGWGWRAMLRDY